MEEIRDLSRELAGGTPVEVGTVFQILGSLKDPGSHIVTLQELKDQLWRLRQKLPIKMPKVLLALVHAHGKPWGYQNIQFSIGYRSGEDEVRDTASARPN